MTTFYNKWCKYWLLHYLYIPIIIISGLVISCHLKLQRLMSQKIENPIRNKSEKWDLIFFTYINILKTLLGMSFTFTQNNHSKWTLLVSNINQASWDLSSIKSGISRYWSKHFFYFVFGIGRLGLKGVCNENWGKHRMIIQDTFMQDQYRISAKSNLSYLYSYMTWIIRGSSIYSWHHL